MKLEGIDMEQLLAHFSMVATDVELNDSQESIDEKQGSSILQIFSFQTAVATIRLMYMLSLSALSVISLILAVHIADSMFVWLNPNGIFAVQIIPEAKVLNEIDDSNKQPFAYNYLSFSSGFGVVFVYSLLYGVIT